MFYNENALKKFCKITISFPRLKAHFRMLQITRECLGIRDFACGKLIYNKSSSLPYSFFFFTKTDTDMKRREMRVHGMKRPKRLLQVELRPVMWSQHRQWLVLVLVIVERQHLYWTCIPCGCYEFLEKRRARVCLCAVHDVHRVYSLRIQSTRKAVVTTPSLPYSHHHHAHWPSSPR